MTMPLLRLSDIPDGGAVVREGPGGAGVLSVLITRRGAQVRAFRNACPHARHPLERFDGTVLTADGFVLCAAHAASFDPMSGRCVGGPAAGRALVPLRLRLEGEWVWLEDPG